MTKILAEESEKTNGAMSISFLILEIQTSLKNFNQETENHKY